MFVNIISHFTDKKTVLESFKELLQGHTTTKAWEPRVKPQQFGPGLKFFATPLSQHVSCFSSVPLFSWFMEKCFSSYIIHSTIYVVSLPCLMTLKTIMIPTVFQHLTINNGQIFSKLGTLYWENSWIKSLTYFCQ